MKSRLDLCIILCALALVACAHNPALEKGDEYYAAGDWERAEESYRAALSNDPDSSEARTKLERARRQRLESLRVQAEQSIATRQYLSAIAKARAAHETLPRAQTTAEILELVMDAARQHSRALIDGGELVGAIELWAAVRDQLPPFREEATSAHAKLVKREVANLVEEANTSSAKGLDGATLLVWAKIVELSPTPFHKARYERAKAAVESETLYPITVATADTSFAKDVLDGLRTRVEQYALRRKGFAMHIVEEENDARAALRFELEPATFETTEGSRSEKKKYQSGTRDVPNPRRAEVEEKLAEEETKLAELEKNLARKEAEVLEEQAKVTSPTANITSLAISMAARARERDAAAAQVKRQSRKVEEARVLVHETPAQIEEPVYADFVYEVRSVSRHAESRLHGKIVHSDKRPEIAFDVSVSDRLTDTGHDAHPQVDLGADSVVVPSDRNVEAALAATVARRLHDSLLASFTSYREGLVAQAEATDSELERLHFYVLHVIADPKRAEPHVVNALAEATGLSQSAILSLASRI